MSEDNTIVFAQENFGSDNGLPAGHSHPPIPPWLSDRERELVVQMVPDDELIVENNDHANEHPNEGFPPNIDALAYYLPFHFYRNNWGIYIRVNGIFHLANVLATRRPAGTTAIDLAFRLLLDHEHMHFLAEVAASRIEIVSGTATYIPYFNIRKNSEHEEAISNAGALPKAGWGVSKSQLGKVHDWMKNQRLGYRDYHLWVGAALDIGKRKAAQNMIVAGGITFDLVDPPAEFLFEHHSPVWPPTYLVFEKCGRSIGVIRPLPAEFGLQVFVHKSNDHKPPHFHVDFKDGISKKNNRFEWDSLDPVRRPRSGRATEPNSKQRKDLERYVKRYWKDIDDDVKSVQWK